MQLCCGGWGDVALPLSPGELDGYVTSVRGREPIPEWLVEIVHILADEGEAKFKPLKIRESLLYSPHHVTEDWCVLGPCSFIRYQDIKDLPSNFVALGDAMLQLNPIYAYAFFPIFFIVFHRLTCHFRQGCSKAMMGAVTLNSLLASCIPIPRPGAKDEMPADFGQKYFRDVSNHGQALW